MFVFQWHGIQQSTDSLLFTLPIVINIYVYSLSIPISSLIYLFFPPLPALSLSLSQLFPALLFPPPTPTPTL